MVIINDIIAKCGTTIEEFKQAIERCETAATQHSFDPINEISNAVETCRHAIKKCKDVISIIETKTDNCKAVRLAIVPCNAIILKSIQAIRECYAAIRVCFTHNGDSESTIRILEEAIIHCERAGEESAQVLHQFNGILESCQEIPEPERPDPERPWQEKEEVEYTSDDFNLILATTAYTNMKVISEAPAMAQAFNYLNASQTKGMMFHNSAHAQYHQSLLEQATASKGVAQSYQADAMAKARAMMKEIRRTP